jgi:hypothetical protein
VKKILTPNITSSMRILSFVVGGGENEYMTEELWGCPKDNLLDKINIYNSIYPKDEYNTTQSKIYKDEDDIGFIINIKRLKTKK